MICRLQIPVNRSFNYTGQMEGKPKKFLRVRLIEQLAPGPAASGKSQIIFCMVLQSMMQILVCQLCASSAKQVKTQQHAKVITESGKIN